MDKNTRLKADHKRWEGGAVISEDLKNLQNSLTLKSIYRLNSASMVAHQTLQDNLENRLPARNGFIFVYDRTFTLDKGDRPQPEDADKVRAQLNQAIRLYRRSHIAYHKYPKSMRVPGMVGTFAQNDRVPTVGQMVWFNPAICGRVIRVCTGSPSILSFVDVRIDNASAIFTYTHDQLFDHKPAIADYETDNGTISVWE